MSDLEQQDPLADRFSLISSENRWVATELTNLSFLSSAYNLASNPKYFILGKPANSYWGAGVGERVDVAEFAEGKVNGDLGLWLNCGDLDPEPLARWHGSTFPKRQVLKAQMGYLQSSGSIVMSSYYMGQIEKEITAYFKAKVKLEQSNPSHPALAYAPKSEADIDKVELLWLQYWNIALQRRTSKSFNIANRKLNYAQRVPLVALDIPQDKKVLFSEMSIFDGERILQNANIPNDWIANIYDFETVFLDRAPDWAMPEIAPK